MFERYTEAARRVLFFARYEAGTLGGNAIDPSHLLLGLIHDNAGITSRIFARARLPLDRVRLDLQALTTARTPRAPSAEIPFGADTSRVLQLAVQEADRLLHQHIGPEHLLLGILRDEGSPVTSLLNTHGLHIAAVRNDIVGFLNEKQTLVRPPKDGGRNTPSAAPQVHISTTARSEQERASETRGSFWTFEGMPLHVALSRAFDVQEDHIDLPARLQADDMRYDFAVLAPGPDNPETMRRLLQRELEKYFDISITREVQLRDVYVVSVEPKVRPDDEGSMAGGSSFATRSEIGDSIGRVMEAGMDLLNKTMSTDKPDGATEVVLVRDSDLPAELIADLRAQLGIVITPDRRDVTMLVVRSRQSPR